MRDVDFLPSWYKNNIKREISFRAQYSALAGLLIFAIIWNVFATRSISKEIEQIAEIKAKQTRLEFSSQQFNKVNSDVESLKEKLELLNSIDPRINVASVLAEISYILEDKIVLSDMNLTSKKIEMKKTDKKAGIRMAKNKNSNDSGDFLGNVKFVITIKGIAAEASDVASLIRRLEDSSYFFKVYPSYSRNIPLRTNEKTSDEALTVSEFEITCELANYKDNDYIFAKLTAGNY